MLTLPFSAPADRPLRILALGAHSDDVEIGAGATILRTLAEAPAVEVCWAVVSAVGERADEARASAADLLAGATSVDVVVGDFVDGYLPYHALDVKHWVHAVAERMTPDVVLTHQRADLHQDHRFLAELALNAFRDHLILGFEIPKFDGDLGAPNVFVHVDEATFDRKMDVLRRHFETQRGKPWFDDDIFRGLMRLRGMESRAPSGLAEAFYCTKLVTGPT